MASKIKVWVCLIILGGLIFAEEVKSDSLHWNINPLKRQKLFFATGDNWIPPTIINEINTSVEEPPEVKGRKMQMAIGMRGGFALVIVPDWWINIQTPVTTSVNLKICYWNMYILECGLTYIWAIQDWWNLNPYVWEVAIEGNNRKAINPRVGIDYYTGYQPRLGWNLGIHFSLPTTQKFYYNLLVLLRFEDMYGSLLFEIPLKPRGIYGSFGVSYNLW